MDSLKKIFGDSVLHDYRMEKMEIDYPKGVIILHFLDFKNELKSFVIKQFLSVEFTNKEEWGKGTYIVWSDVFDTDEICDIEIQFNSGDICKIKCYK